MDRNQVIGIVLIMATFMLWTITSSPSKEEMEKSKRIRDSIALENQAPLKVQSSAAISDMKENAPLATQDSSALQENKLKYGAFAPSAIGDLHEETLENEFIRITFTNKGGNIKDVLLKKHYKTVTDSSGKESKELIKMLNSAENKFNFLIPVDNTISKVVNTSDLYFAAEKKENTISFKAAAGNGAYFEQKYELSPDNYTLQ